MMNDYKDTIEEIANDVQPKQNSVNLIFSLNFVIDRHKHFSKQTLILEY